MFVTTSRSAQRLFAAILGIACNLQSRRVDAQTADSLHAPINIATGLARSGYVALPFDWQLGYQFVTARIDTTPVTLLLDSGFNGDLLLDSALTTLSSIHPTTRTGTVATVYGSSAYRNAVVDRISLGSLSLTSVPAVLKSPAQGDGYLGIGVLANRRGVLDFVTDTLYLLGASQEALPTLAAHGPARTLREALVAGKRYHTFLALMQEAGLSPLLETRATAVALDSLAWTNFRPSVNQLPGVDTMPEGRARIIKTREVLNARLRRRGQLTAFVPTDAAFARLSPDTLRALRANRTRLAQVLRAHMLTDTRLDMLAMRTLVDGASQPDKTALRFYTVESRLDVERLTSREDGGVVARATIVDPTLIAPNGVAYGIDRVLLGPPTSALPATTFTRSGYVAIPLYRRPNGYYVLHATINGTRLSLGLDTGAPCDIVLDSAVFQRLPKTSLVLALDSVTTIPVNVSPVDLSRSNQKDRDRDIAPMDGIVGSTLLKQYHAYIDYATATLYLAIPKSKTP